MGRFKSVPAQPLQPPPFDSQINAFVSGAVSHFTPAPTLSTPKGPPWAGHDPRAIARKGINLRLNDWELAVLRDLADREGCSIQQVLKSVLTPALHEYAREQESGGTGTGTGTGRA